MHAAPSKYSPQAFWTKLRTYSAKMGRDLVFSALVLYYTLQDPDLPGWARAKIYGALGYLIFPVDAIPDGWPGGYVDDAAVIALALGAVATIPFSRTPASSCASGLGRGPAARVW